MSNRRVSLLVAAFAGLSASVASADFTSYVRVTVDGVAQDFNIPQSAWRVVDGAADGSDINWADPHQERFYAVGDLDTGDSTFAMVNGASIHGFRVAFRDDPQVTTTFNASASATMNSNIQVDSVIVSGFGTVTGAIGRASAAMTITDSLTSGTPGFLSATGQQPGGMAYSAFFKNPALSGMTFSDLVSLTGGGMGMGGFGRTIAFSGRSDGLLAGPVQFTPVADDVVEMSAQFKFSLSAGDRAAGTSTYEVIPAPSALAVLGLGALAGARRRRS